MTAVGSGSVAGHPAGDDYNTAAAAGLCYCHDGHSVKDKRKAEK